RGDDKAAAELGESLISRSVFSVARRRREQVAVDYISAGQNGTPASQRQSLETVAETRRPLYTAIDPNFPRVMLSKALCF
ncbi:MAG: hypothetical protein L0312_33405, partial [Acidobacteria bacterium]|nr:hypothetical protein [Acidobacteriota bacterium]